jgi:hypothetical protein
MPPVFTNKLRTLGFLQGSAGTRSLDDIALDASLANTGILPCGLVLGKIIATGYWKPSPVTQTDGTQIAIGVLADEYDTAAFDPIYGGVFFAIVRAAEVRAEDLSYDASVTTILQQQQKWAQLLAVGIVVRTMGGVQVNG